MNMWVLGPITKEQPTSYPVILIWYVTCGICVQSSM